MLNFALHFDLFHAELLAIWYCRFPLSLRLPVQFGLNSYPFHYCPLAALHRLRDQSIVKCFVQVSEMN